MGSWLTNRKTIALIAAVLFLVACGVLQKDLDGPTPIPDTCQVVPQLTGEKWVPIVAGTPPPSYAYAGQEIHTSFSGGYLVVNNAVVCGDEGIVDYVHSDELPGWRGERPVRFELDGQRFGDGVCGYGCSITGTIPSVMQVGVYTLYVGIPGPVRDLTFEMFIVHSPTPHVE
jgi:hypothetical protein